MRTIAVFIVVCCASASCHGAATAGHAGSTDPGQPRSMDVEMKSDAGPLHGTLLVPAGKGPFPGVVIIAGSGPTDRDGNNKLLKGPVNNLKDLARHLAGVGFASLRYDKRGVGKTPAGEGAVDADALVADARAAFDFLSARPEIQKDRVALLGHSEGGLVAILAARELPAAALVLASTAGRSLLGLMEEQIKAAFKETMKGEQLAAAEAYLADCMKLLKGEGEVKLDLVPEFFGEDLSFIFTEIAKPQKVAIIRSLYTIDPAEKIASFKGPILIIHGRMDAQVSLDDPKRLEAKLVEAGHKDFKLEIIPSMDHVFKQLGGDKPEPYDGPGRRLSRDFLDRLSGWLEEKLR